MKRRRNSSFSSSSSSSSDEAERRDRRRHKVSFDAYHPLISYTTTHILTRLLFQKSSTRSDKEGEKLKKRRKDKRHRRDKEEDKKRDRRRDKDSKKDKHKSKKHKKDKKKKKERSKHGKSSHGSTAREQDQERRSAQLSQMFGYTNEDNPFGDAQLTEQFVWDKKLKRDKGKRRETATGDAQASRLEEIQKARERRAEREEERMVREQQKEDEARLREAQTFEDWEEKEEEFHLKQQRERSKIRIKQGREKAIDAIAKNLLLFEEYKALKRKEELKKIGDDSVVLGMDIPVEVDEAYKIFRSMKVSEMEDVRKDIEEYRQSEMNDPNATSHREFWDALLLILADDMDRRRVTEGRDRVYASAGLHEKVDSDLQKMLLGKNTEELHALKAKVQDTIQSKDPGVDVEYWEAVLKGVDVAICKKLIDAQHAEILKVRLDLLGAREGSKDAVKRSKSKKPEEDFDKRLEAFKQSIQQEVVVLTAEEDEEQRRVFNEGVFREMAKKFSAEIDKQTELGSAPSLRNSEIDRMIEEQEAKPSAGEEVMPNRDVVKLAPKTYSWQGKYRPRKPRFYNRVKTGYEWNKYNQSHYDEDNPPPKTVQGYKFNIFYPDLIDKQRAPTFRVEKADSPEFCILRFQAGPPYEDIAFKILNREWSKQSFHGFKCVFERGILQLHFQFKRLYYRR